MFSKKRLIPTVVTVLALALLLAACGGGDKDDQAATEDPPAAATVREVRIVLDDFSFEPETITVKSGERVKLVLVNEGSVPHDWRVDNLDLASPLVSPGQTTTFEFTAGAKGSYDSYCAEPGHEVLGMVGSFIIE